LLGFGEKCFGANEIEWNRDPLARINWPREYHGDINLFRGDGSDARVLWELNRLSQLITLGRAYAVVSEARPPGGAGLDGEPLSQEFLRQVRSWRARNPVGRGANWACAMEVALRAMNLLGPFFLFLSAARLDEDALVELLMIFDQHGAHIRRNLEYSHISTSNHYMCDVAGLLWLGVMLPELQDAAEWREFGLRELLNEIDKQILADGADSESSTGYHRLKLELLIYSFVLCRANGIDIDEKYWQKLRAMAEYVFAYFRPDGRAPLIGDSDSGQIFPIVKREGDDHAYLLSLAAAVFQESRFKIAGTQASGPVHAGGERTEELLWLLGEQGLRAYESLPDAPPANSQAFADAGIYILRADDLYLLFNASGCGLKGRGSHGHNDALSIEVSAGSTSLIVDPGSYIYTHNLHERHLFRSTAYHSTVQVDDVEQNTTNETTPFVIGDEAHPRVLDWQTNSEFDYVVAEHNGYGRLHHPVTHRRSVRFDKHNKFWLIEDDFSGAGSHKLITRFHFNSGLDTSIYESMAVLAHDRQSGTRLLVDPLDIDEQPQFEELFTSRNYGDKQPSTAAAWQVVAQMPLRLRWVLLPLRPSEDELERLSAVRSLLR
jgi:hypothetical protein